MSNAESRPRACSGHRRRRSSHRGGRRRRYRCDHRSGGAGRRPAPGCDRRKKPSPPPPGDDGRRAHQAGAPREPRGADGPHPRLQPPDPRVWTPRDEERTPDTLHHRRRAEAACPSSGACRTATSACLPRARRRRSPRRQRIVTQKAPAGRPAMPCRRRREHVDDCSGDVRRASPRPGRPRARAPHGGVAIHADDEADPRSRANARTPRRGA